MTELTEHSENTETQAPLAAAQAAAGPRWAQWVTDIFSPIAVPAYATALALWCGPELHAVPLTNRLLVTFIVFIIAGLAPLLAIGLLIKLGMVSDRAVSRRDQRAVPMSIAAACYVGAEIFMAGIHAPMWLRMFFWGAAAATLIEVFISQAWKISAHTTALGGLSAMALYLAVHGTPDVSSVIIFSITLLIGGLVATTRLLLNRHTPAQVVAGFALGFAVCFALMSL